ncbi:MAG: hypothetical protein LBK63_01720 [Treponema sp.]|jgi:hypothetical protein|nr:hypothetical protein [Treponema sp.]
MADKLDWMHKHFILLRYITIQDLAAGEGFKIRPDLEALYAGVSGVEDMALRLAGQGNYKDACELLAYGAHRRAGIWWGYRCVLSLLEELRAKPPVDRDIADIGANFDVTVPDFAKVKLPDPPDLSEMNAIFAKLKPETQAMRAKADPVVMKLVDDAMAVAFGEFEKVHGIHPLELVKQLCARLAQDPAPIDPNSPIFVAQAELRAKLQAVQKETVDTIKSVLPPKAPEHEKKVRDNALSAVYRWVAAPDEVNAQRCLEVGNECPDTPAGLLSLAAFWAFGNLMPGGEQAVPTPPGLAANGLTQTLLMCALHKGGTRKVKERYELYFDLGVDVISGKDNWEESLADGTAPHETAAAQAAPENGKPSAEPAAEKGQVPPPANGNGNGVYKRWTPEIPGT